METLWLGIAVAFAIGLLYSLIRIWLYGEPPNWIG
jgi:hypothetical protein